MKLLNTYENRDEAEEAAEKLAGEKRLASERDATVTIYNLLAYRAGVTSTAWVCIT